MTWTLGWVGVFFVVLAAWLLWTRVLLNRKHHTEPCATCGYHGGHRQNCSER